MTKREFVEQAAMRLLAARTCGYAEAVHNETIYDSVRDADRLWDEIEKQVPADQPRVRTGGIELTSA